MHSPAGTADTVNLVLYQCGKPVIEVLGKCNNRSSLDAKVVLGKTQPSGLEAWVRCEQFERGYSRKQRHIYIKMQRMFTERCL